MHQLAQDESVRYPLAQHVLQKEIYVDDVQSGHDTVDGAIKIREDLIAALQSAGMCLRKWASNHPDLLVNIAQEHMSNSTILEVDNHDSIKTLVARLYDPLGFIVPVITTAKAILKDVWSVRIERTAGVSSPLEWDETLPLDLRERWNDYITRLPDVEAIQVPRWLMFNVAV
ncbi:uncharacterized protein LOC122320853 [Drosophila ficusphila]|uniref:uncharacterized protein LOC122320853 n=1 Tax=Drosophila ficusphila TaxID=30025 RepID=UPI001C8A20F4|nr:uncharacterized protein LOC122320853 [Drosophila ficusphila]